MRKTKTLRRTTLGLCALALLVVGLAGVSEVASQTPTARETTRAGSTVLYSVHQGSPRSAVDTYHKLVALRDSQGFEKADNSGTFVYLNQPVNPKDQLIEVRIPIANARALKRDRMHEAARALGLGTTDTKDVPESTVVAITKPAGVTDPGPYYQRLYSYIDARGFASTEAPAETFGDAEAIPAVCTYDELETELAVSVAFVADASKAPFAAKPGREGRQ
jgi:hypothetical protein